MPLPFRRISFLLSPGPRRLRPWPRSRRSRARPKFRPRSRFIARNGMVVAQESRAARIGVEILDRGGNAVDAAVAVGFALAVTYPRAGNIGGGGFMVIHLAKTGQDIAIDYRETAPAAATATMFLDAQRRSRSEEIARQRAVGRRARDRRRPRARARKIRLRQVDACRPDRAGDHTRAQRRRRRRRYRRHAAAGAAAHRALAFERTGFSQQRWHRAGARTGSAAARSRGDAPHHCARRPEGILRGPCCGKDRQPRFARPAAS